MPIPYTDDFTNTNGTNIVTHDSDYVEDTGGAEIQSNSAQGTTAGQVYVRYTGGAANNDQKITGTLSTDASGGAFYAQLLVRSTVTSGQDGYIIYGNSSSDHELGRIDNGTGTKLGAELTTWVDADVLELRAVGTTISVDLNGSQDESVTDSTYSSGEHGVGFYQNNANARWNSITYANTAGGIEIFRRRIEQG